ncbi:Calcium-binding mitochondrial carrier protein [Alternaria alternata]|nr:Calcium-binding mitochondrial carrier protein [Alternaria alternata]
MATVTEEVREVLLGTTDEPQLSQLTRAAFMKHAQKDESGEYYLDQDQFITAVAPEGEDYVSRVVCISIESSKLMTCPLPAQDQAVPVWHPLPGRRSRPEGQGQHP